MNILQNAFYHADSLALLERIPNESIDLVYVDPPWYTQSEFSNEDDAESSTEYYKYFMRIVIRHFKRVLKPTGNMMIHISPEAGNYIRPLIYEVFSENHFRPEINIPRTKQIQTQPAYRATHEQVLFYVMSNDSTFNTISRPYTEDELQHQGYQQDENGNHYRLIPLNTQFSPSERPSLNYEFNGFSPSDNLTWRFPYSKMEQLWNDGKIEVSDGGQRLMWKDYLEDRQYDSTHDWDNIPLYDRKKRSEYDFGFARSEELVQRIIDIGSNPGDIVLDVFAGSATTLGIAHKMDRYWIGCDNSKEAINIGTRWLESEIGISFGSDGVQADESYLETNFPIVRRYGKFFLSYKSENRGEFVRPFHETLEEYEIDHWWDQKDIPAGKEWEQRIKQGLDECDALILFITPEAIASPWVMKECKHFIDANKPIFPICCKDTPLADIPKNISKFQFTEFEKYETKLIPELYTFNPERLNS